MSGCVSSQEDRLKASAEALARHQAGTHLPEWPAYCREEMPAVTPKLNEPVWGSQARWMVVRQNENARDAWCAGFYERVAAMAAAR